MCFFSPIRNDPKKKAHKQIIGTHPVPGQSRKICLCLCVFFLSLTFRTKKATAPECIVVAAAVPFLLPHLPRKTSMILGVADSPRK